MKMTISMAATMADKARWEIVGRAENKTRKHLEKNSDLQDIFRTLLHKLMTEKSGFTNFKSLASQIRWPS